MVSSGGTGSVTIKDVARAADVSPSVVSRILNEDATLRVRHDTRKRVLQVIDEMGYRANSTARSLRLSRTNVFGLVTHDLSNPIYAEIINGTFDGCSAHGYSMIMADADELNRDLRRFEGMLRSRQVDGVLLLRNTVASDSDLAQLAAASVPTVLLMDAAREGVSTVSIDDEASVYAGVRHLIELGHHRIGHLTGLQSWRSDSRHHGYVRAMQEAGIDPRTSWVRVGGWTADEGRQGMQQLMADNPRSGDSPTAVFVSNTLAALGALDTARQLGLSVPQDISIASLHDTWLADLVTPALTTVRTPLAELGRQAVEVLVQQQQERSDVNHVVAAKSLVIERQSTAPPKT